VRLLRYVRRVACWKSCQARAASTARRVARAAAGGGGGHADAAAVLTALVDASASPAPPDAPRAERALNLLRAIAPKLQTLDPRALRSLATDEALARSVAGATVCERMPARAVAAAVLVALAPAAAPPLARTLLDGSSELYASTSAAATIIFLSAENTDFFGFFVTLDNANRMRSHLGKRLVFLERFFSFFPAPSL
jgi:hypothetical protein